VTRAPARYETEQDYRTRTPIHAVWELTLACNLKCAHCGSRAGKRRPAELSTAECLDLVAQLARMGTREVTLIGGEAYLREDWIEIVRAVGDHGMNCAMQTGGFALTPERIERAAAAGLKSCGVSLDGLPRLHDRLRGVPGSFRQAMTALEELRRCGVPTSANTQIGAEVMPDLRPLMHRIADAGAKSWQIQLTVAMGNAADRPELLLQPYQLLEVMPLLAELFEEALERDLRIQPGNNVGYFGPYEHLWRVVDERVGHYQGCSAGHTTIAIEADGTIKGCPSLPTVGYAGGNVRDRNMEEIFRTTDALRFTQDRTADDLWGTCASCYYADVCRAGCTWTSHSLLGRAGNNPYCHHRALELEKRGLRERVVKVADAPGRSFDHGRFALVVESLDGERVHEVVEPPPVRADRPRIREHRVPPVLELCRGCDRFVLPATLVCPHCGSDVVAMAARHAADVAELEDAARAVRRMLEAPRAER
jgi:Y-X(10)_GDL-associated radical SAM protein